MNLSTPRAAFRGAAFLAYLCALVVVFVTFGLGILIANPGWRSLSPGHLLIAMLGLGGVVLLVRARLPTELPSRRAALLAFASGLPFGLFSIVLVQYAMPVAVGGPLPPFLQPFPWSLPFYFSGAVVTEAMFRLIPFVCLLALYRTLVPSSGEVPFWVLAVLVAVCETFLIAQEVPPELFAIIVVVPLFSLLQAWWLKHEGWVAALLARLGQYSIWHVGFGLWVQYG